MTALRFFRAGQFDDAPDAMEQALARLRRQPAGTLLVRRSDGVVLAWAHAERYQVVPARVEEDGRVVARTLERAPAAPAQLGRPHNQGRGRGSFRAASSYTGKAANGAVEAAVLAGVRAASGPVPLARVAAAAGLRPGSAKAAATTLVRAGLLARHGYGKRTVYTATSTGMAS